MQRGMWKKSCGDWSRQRWNRMQGGMAEGLAIGEVEGGREANGGAKR